jgi:hypothetical protein
MEKNWVQWYVPMGDLKWDHGPGWQPGKKARSYLQNKEQVELEV